MEYRGRSRRAFVFIAVLMAAGVLAGIVSIFVNHYTGLTVGITWDTVMAHLRGDEYGVYYYDLIVWEYFVPQSMMAVFVGAGLAVGGAGMQTMLRNPIADPYTTGVASGASFGVALYLMMDIALLPMGSYNMTMTVNAMVFALIPTGAIVLISRRKNMTPTTTILAGVAVMFVFRAATSLMTLLADPDAVEQLYMWNVGSLTQAAWDNIWFVGGVTLLCIVALLLLSRQMSIMTAGENSARSMGVRTRMVRTVALIIVAVMTAVIVGFTGTIGFMGLVAPHVARVIVGSDLRKLIPCSAACGAVILALCECVAKAITASAPIGVITAIIGGPLFIYLLIKGAKKVWY